MLSVLCILTDLSYFICFPLSLIHFHVLGFCVWRCSVARVHSMVLVIKEMATPIVQLLFALSFIKTLDSAWGAVLCYLPWVQCLKLLPILLVMPLKVLLISLYYLSLVQFHVGFWRSDSVVLEVVGLSAENAEGGGVVWCVITHLAPLYFIQFYIFEWMTMVLRSLYAQSL